MSEETSAIPAEVPQEHVTLGDGGVIMLSPEAEAAMEGVEAPVTEEPAQEATPAAPVIPPAPEARKIKYNGEEVEVPADKEIEYLQKGYNYEQKMQALEAQRAKLTAFEGVMSAMEASPAIRQKVAEALGHAQPQPEKQPQFDDPIEQLKYETVQATLQAVKEQYIDPLQHQTQKAAYDAAVASVKQQTRTDPQYTEIQAAIEAQVMSLPRVIGEPLWHQLSNDPQAYMEMFQATKQRLTSTSAATTKLSEPTELPQPTKRETKAPLLESGNNNAPDATEIQRQKDHIKALEKRSREGDFRATGELLELMA